MVQPLRGLSIPREQKRLLVGGDTGGVVGGLWLVVMVINGWWLATGIAELLGATVGQHGLRAKCHGMPFHTTRVGYLRSWIRRILIDLEEGSVVMVWWRLPRA